MERDVWDAGLSDVPTEHILPCLRRAMAHKRDDYMMRTAAILREWDAVKEELRQERETHAAAMDRALMAGHGTLTGRMSLGEWKERHNLPPEWKLGKPFPEQSDLFGRSVPPPHGEIVPAYAGRWDAKWYIRKAPLPTAAQKAAQREAARRQMEARAAERTSPVDAGAWSRIRGADLEPQPQPHAAAVKAANDDPAEIEF